MVYIPEKECPLCGADYRKIPAGRRKSKRLYDPETQRNLKALGDWIAGERKGDLILKAESKE